MRIFPAYVLVVVCYGFFVVGLLKECTLSEYFEHYSLISFWTKGDLKEWYVAAIIALYIIAPLLYQMLERSGKLFGVCIALVVAVCVLISLAAGLPHNISIINEIFISRVPAFMEGMLIGKIISKKGGCGCETKTYLVALGTISILLLGIYLTQGRNQLVLSRLMYAPWWICFIVSIFNIQTIRKRNVLSFLGEITFEIYLLHEKILGITYALCSRAIKNVFISSIVDNAFAVLISVFIAWILHSCNDFVLRKIMERNKKCQLKVF